VFNLLLTKKEASSVWSCFSLNKEIRCEKLGISLVQTTWGGFFLRRDMRMVTHGGDDVGPKLRVLEIRGLGHFVETTWKT